MGLRVLFFASARHAAGCSETTMDCEQEGVSEAILWERLLRKFPRLSSLRATMRIARNHEYLVSGEMLHSGDEVALIPPVSGG